MYPLAVFYLFFFFNDTATTEIYTLSLHDALPILSVIVPLVVPSMRTEAPMIGSPAASLTWPLTVDCAKALTDRRRPTTKRSEEHTSELQSRQYLVCRLLLEKKKKIITLI